MIATLELDLHGVKRLKITPDGTLVIVSAGLEPGCAGPQARQFIRRPAIGHGSAGPRVELSGEVAFIACGRDNHVAVVDLRSFKVTGHIDAGAGRNRLGGQTLS